MLEKNLKAILTIMLLGAFLGGLSACDKDNKVPDIKTTQLAGTHWEGTITFNNPLLEPVAYRYSVLFFSSSEGEATIPEFQEGERAPRRVTVPFKYSIEPSFIKFEPTPAGSDPMYTYSIRECLSGTWLLKEFSEGNITFYRKLESEVIVSLKKLSF